MRQIQNKMIWDGMIRDKNGNSEIVRLNLFPTSRSGLPPCPTKTHSSFFSFSALAYSNQRSSCADQWVHPFMTSPFPNPNPWPCCCGWYCNTAKLANAVSDCTATVPRLVSKLRVFDCYTSWTEAGPLHSVTHCSRSEGQCPSANFIYPFMWVSWIAIRRWKGMAVWMYRVPGELGYGWFTIGDTGQGWLRKSKRGSRETWLWIQERRWYFAQWRDELARSWIHQLQIPISSRELMTKLAGLDCRHGSWSSSRGKCHP